MNDFPHVTNWWYICGACWLMSMFVMVTLILFEKKSDRD